MNPYESDIFDILERALKHRYGVSEEHQLYPILLTRHSLLSSPKNIPSLISFLLSDLNLSEKCLYNDIEIGFGTTLQHFVENLVFRASLYYEEKELKSIRENISKSAKFRAIKLRKIPEYDYFYKLHVIDEIKKYFCCDFYVPERINEFHYPDIDLIYQRTLEEQLDAHIHAIKLHSEHVAFVSERQVEEYLSRNLSLLEPDLRLIERQVIVSEGRIDILARDKNGTDVIIEVKVEEDKDIIWQCLHYPKEFQQIQKVDKVRMITFCPEYRKHIKAPLVAMGNVEMYEYKVVSSGGKIERMEVKKLKADKDRKIG